MTKKLFTEITAWQKETFATATAFSKLNHLDEELEELRVAIAFDTTEKQSEWADCFILLFGAAASDGMSYEDICQAIQEKHLMNKERKWGKPDENGVIRHEKNENTVCHRCDHCDMPDACADFGCAIAKGIVTPVFP